MKFCKKCGRQLADGEVCDCTAGNATSVQRSSSIQASQAPRKAPPQQTAPASYRTAQPTPPSRAVPPPAQPRNTQRTSPRAPAQTPPQAQSYATPNTPGSAARSTAGQSAIGSTYSSFKQKAGIGRKASFSGDTYERGLQIVPDIVEPSDGEIPVRQYNIAILRTLMFIFLPFMRAEGRMQITNKRVIFRAPGRDILGGRTTIQHEYAIDEVAGLEAKRDYKFRVQYLLAAMVTLGIVPLIAGIMRNWRNAIYWVKDHMRLKWVVIIPIALFLVGFLVADVIVPAIDSANEEAYKVADAAYKKELNVARAAGKPEPVAPVRPTEWGSSAVVKVPTTILKAPGYALAFVAVVLFTFFYIVCIVRYCLRPNLVISIKNKMGLGEGPIDIRHATMKTEATGFAEVMPTDETEAAIREIGAIINDIQKLGDYGVQKWTV